MLLLQFGIWHDLLVQQKAVPCDMGTVEAKYVAACSTSCEAVWLRKLLSDLFDLQLDATCIYCDNQTCVKLSENSVFHDKSKHIEIKYHYIKDMVQ